MDAKFEEMEKLVEEVTSLDELYDLVKSGRLDDYECWEYFPTFGGRAPRDMYHTWSWDETRLMCGTCADDMQLVPRGEEVNYD